MSTTTIVVVIAHIASFSTYFGVRSAHSSVRRVVLFEFLKLPLMNGRADETHAFTHAVDMPAEEFRLHNTLANHP